MTFSIPTSIKTDKNPPMGPKVKKNINAMISKNDGIAVYFPVKTLSTFKDILCPIVSEGLET